MKITNNCGLWFCCIVNFCSLFSANPIDHIVWLPLISPHTNKRHDVVTRKLDFSLSSNSFKRNRIFLWKRKITVTCVGLFLSDHLWCCVECWHIAHLLSSNLCRIFFHISQWLWLRLDKRIKQRFRFPRDWWDWIKSWKLLSQSRCEALTLCFLTGFHWSCVANENYLNLVFQLYIWNWFGAQRSSAHVSLLCSDTRGPGECIPLASHCPLSSQLTSPLIIGSQELLMTPSHTVTITYPHCDTTTSHYHQPCQLSDNYQNDSLL